jgi:hypothetical protein
MSFHSFQTGLRAQLRMPGGRRRPLAALLVLLIAGIAAWCLTATPPPIVVAKKGGYTDVRLYHDITAQVAKGQHFYAATAQLQRLHHYPLKPFITVRQPTEIMFAARFGWKIVQYVCMAALFTATFLWVIATEGKFHLVERIALLGAMGAGGSQVTSERILALQEYPAGQFIGIGLALWIGWRKQWWLPMIPIMLALFIRELTLPFVLLALAFAAWERNWREVAGWVAILALWSAFMAWHATQVMATWLPTDISSRGWHGLQGYSGFLKSVIFTSTLQPLPLGVALLVASLPLVGWASLKGRTGLFCNLLVWGYALMIGVFSRADTFYWGAIMLPWYFVGYVLIPRALLRLWAAWNARLPEVEAPALETEAAA